MAADPDRGRASRALSHPAALLVLTAALTGLLAPWITNRWEARDRDVEAHRVAAERELQVKTAIVSRVGSASGDFLSAVEVGMIGGGGAEARREYRAFRAAAFEIGSQVAAYFPDSLSVIQWRDHTYALRNLHLALTMPEGRARAPWLHLLNKYLDRKPGAYAGLCLGPESIRYQRALRRIVIALQNKQQALVRGIVASPTVLTGTPTPDESVVREHFETGQHAPC